MSDDFYPFVDSGDPAPDNAHLLGGRSNATADAESPQQAAEAERVRYATRIAVYDDMLSTPRVLVIDPADVRTYLEEVTNTVYRCMKEQGGSISLMVIREIVENFIHAHFVEPIISILDNGNTVRFADQGPGIGDKERAFEFGVTSADREQKRYIRGTGAGFPMVQQYLENAGGAVSIEDNMGQGTVVTVTVDPARTEEVSRSASRGAVVRGGKRAAAAATTQLAMQSTMAVPTEMSGTGAMQAPSGMQAPAPGMPPQAMEQGAPMQQMAAQPVQQPQQPLAAQQGYAYPYGAYPPAYPYPPQMQQQPQGMQQAAWPGYQNGYAMGYAAGYPPYPMPGQQPQMPGMNASATMPSAGAAPEAAASGPWVSERGMLALSYLAQHGTCGPTDLAAALGSSNATWSRELETLSNQGLVVKKGQKRVLTEMGQMWLSQHMGGEQA